MYIHQYLLLFKLITRYQLKLILFLKIITPLTIRRKNSKLCLCFICSVYISVMGSSSLLFDGFWWGNYIFRVSARVFFYFYLWDVVWGVMGFTRMYNKIYIFFIQNFVIWLRFMWFSEICLGATVCLWGHVDFFDWRYRLTHICPINMKILIS